MFGGSCLRDLAPPMEAMNVGPAGTELLQLVARLPFLSEHAMELVSGLPGGTTYRHLTQLREGNLIDWMRPTLRAGHNPRLWYLTDLGLATIAAQLDRDAGELARSYRLRGRDLLARLPQLHHLQAVYDLLGALVSSRRAPAKLVAWECPWRRTIATHGRSPQRPLRFPAHVSLAWDDWPEEYLLLPDLATVPLRFYQPAIVGLFALRAAGEVPPTLLVATSHPGRGNAWRDLIETVRERKGEAALPIAVVTWDELRTGHLAAIPRGMMVAEWFAEQAVRRHPSKAHPDRHLGRTAVLVGSALRSRMAGTDVDHGAIALQIGAVARDLLDAIGRHPFLTADQLAVVVGRANQAVRDDVTWLVGHDLVRIVGGDEARGIGKDELLELTVQGLGLAAAHLGLSLAQAVRFNGLAGGGPEHPVGSRETLVRQLAHTRGSDAIFVSLSALAHQRADRGLDDALVEWRNAAACARGRVRPDGYGIYRQHGQLHGFFLEYDRGTMGFRGYRAKLNSYGDYLESGRFTRDYVGFPTILVIAADNASEWRIGQATEVAAVGRSLTLPLLLTSAWRVSHQSNLSGLLGPIWREPGKGFHDRQCWPR